MLVIASQRLWCSVSSAFLFLCLDLTFFIVQNVHTLTLTRVCFQTASAFLVQNLLVMEIYLR